MEARLHERVTQTDRRFEAYSALAMVRQRVARVAGKLVAAPVAERPPIMKELEEDLEVERALAARFAALEEAN